MSRLSCCELGVLGLSDQRNPEASICRRYFQAFGAMLVLTLALAMLATLLPLLPPPSLHPGLRRDSQLRRICPGHRGAAAVVPPGLRDQRTSPPMRWSALAWQPAPTCPSSSHRVLPPTCELQRKGPIFVGPSPWLIWPLRLPAPRKRPALPPPGSPWAWAGFRKMVPPPERPIPSVE